MAALGEMGAGLIFRDFRKNFSVCEKRNSGVLHMAGHTQRQWQGKFFRCGMRCFYCHKPLLIEEATKEHLTPVSRGGPDTIDNIVPACIECNQRKGAMTLSEFRKTFSTAFEILRGVGEAEIESSVNPNYSMVDAPLLCKLRKENESTSWAWRHPA